MSYTHKRQVKPKSIFENLENLVDTKTAAKALGFTPGTLRNWKWRGAPARRISGRLKWDLRELCDWLERNS